MEVTTFCRTKKNYFRRVLVERIPEAKFSRGKFIEND